MGWYCKAYTKRMQFSGFVEEMEKGKREKQHIIAVKNGYPNGNCNGNCNGNKTVTVTVTNGNITD